LLEAVDFDMPLAGAELPCRDVVAICDARILNRVESILLPELNRERLVLDTVRTSTYAESTPFVERSLRGSCKGLLSGR
jgi:hypothetical protein